MTIQIILNGKILDTQSVTLLDLVQELSLEGKRYAIELNENIIPKSQLIGTLIRSNDRVEIIQAVGGG